MCPLVDIGFVYREKGVFSFLFLTCASGVKGKPREDFSCIGASFTNSVIALDNVL